MLLCKGILISSHLNSRDTKDVVRFCLKTGLFQRNQNSAEVELVQQVFSQESDGNVQKRILGLLAQNDFILCLLMEPRNEKPTG